MHEKTCQLLLFLVAYQSSIPFKGKFTATKSVDFLTYFYLKSDFKHEGNHVHTNTCLT